MQAVGLDAYLVDECDYDRVRLIGSGRLGDMWLYTRDDKFYAIRCVTAGSEGPHFIREIEVFAILRPHPAVCGFCGFTLRSRMVVCEYLPNGSLEALFKEVTESRAPPSWTPTLKSKIIFGVAAAMGHLHGIGAVHRYLSPSNILFDGNWDPKLTDFGFARIIDTDSAKMSMRPGDKSLEYMAPELLDGTEFTADADMYSYGVIVAQVCNDGEFPFPRTRTVVAARRVVSPRIPESLSPILTTLIEYCLERGVGMRPPFAHILSRLFWHEEPLFPDVDMVEYREYRNRIFSATLVGEDYQEVLETPPVRAEDKAEFEEAVRRASSGDPKEELRLGRMCERGFGVERNLELAFDYYLSAAEKGESLAQLNVGICYLKGVGVEMSTDDAFAWLEEAATDPHLPIARCKLGMALWKYSVDPRDRLRGFELLKASADLPVNNQEEQYEVGVAYEDGDDVVGQDFALAKHYYEMAAASGFEPARVNLANMALLGKGDPADIDKGIRILEQAAVQQATMAMCNLGEIYSDDRYGRQDLEKAKQWFKKAADLNFPYGMLKLGVALRREAIANPDRALELNRESARYMRDAAERGNVVAMTNFGKFLMEGTGVRVNFPAAIDWLNQAAETASPTQSAGAQFLLGQILYDGKGGMETDRNSARVLWQRAAAAGNANARAALATHFP